MKLAAIGMQWSFSTDHVRRSRCVSPDHAAEHAMLAEIELAERRVRAAIERAMADGATVICLAGSTLPVGEHVVPDWLLEMSAGVTICFETFTGAGTAKAKIADPEGENLRRAWVVHDGKVALGPVRQLVVDAKSGAKAKSRLREAVLSGRRTVDLDGGVGVLLICGEILLIEGKDDSPAGVGFRDPGVSAWWEGLPELVVVLNPTHTPMKLPAIDAKRKWASERGAVLAPNNSAPEVDKREGRWRWDSDVRTGFAYQRGDRVGPSQMLGVGGGINDAKPTISYADCADAERQPSETETHPHPNGGRDG